MRRWINRHCQEQNKFRRKNCRNLLKAHTVLRTTKIPRANEKWNEFGVMMRTQKLYTPSTQRQTETVELAMIQAPNRISYGLHLPSSNWMLLLPFDFLVFLFASLPYERSVLVAVSKNSVWNNAWAEWATDKIHHTYTHGTCKAHQVVAALSHTLLHQNEK